MEIEEVESDELRSERQQRILNVRKVKSRDAARNRRSKENTQYLELAKLLPFPSSVTSQLDKASIIRLTISFLKYQELSSKAFRRRIDQGSPKHNQNHVNGKGTSGAFARLFSEDLGCHLLQALDGFLFCVSIDGKFIYISETVTTHLGLSQLDLIGTNVFNIIHPDDQKSFSELLNRNLPNSYHSLPFHAFDDFDAMTSNEMQYNINTNQESISTFTRMKCALIKRAGCYVKSSGYKVIHISGKLVPYRNMDRNGFRSHALVATGQPLPPPTICELKLDTKVFVSRVSMDLKIVFCEGRIRNYMNFKARDIVGLSAYEFYHSNDMQIVHKGHHDCLQSGKCVTSAYRWINKDGGYVWMQTVGTVIKRHGPYGEESQILCVNYISSEVEGDGAVIHNLQQHFKQLEMNDHLADNDPYDDYGLDSRHVDTITSSDITSMYAHQKNGDAVMDKEDFIKTVRYDTVWYGNNQNEVRMPQHVPSNYSVPQVPHPPPSLPQTSQDDGFDPLDDLGVPFVERIPSLQETHDQEEAERLFEFMTDPYSVEFNDNACGSESGFSDMSPGQVQSQMNGNSSPPGLPYPVNSVVSPSNFKSNNHPTKNMYSQQRTLPPGLPNNIHSTGQKYLTNNMSNAIFYNNNYYQSNTYSHHNANSNSSSIVHSPNHNLNPVVNLNPNMDTVVKSELPSPPPRQVISWKGGNRMTNDIRIPDNVVYLQHPTQYNNIVENSVAMDISDGAVPNYPESNNYRSGSSSHYNSGANIETMSLLKQLENNQNGYLNDISIEQSMYGCHMPPVTHRDYP